MYTKELYLEFYWQTLFKDDHTFVTNYDQCQRTWTITKRHEMPLSNILEVKIFYIKGINSMEPFPLSRGNEYILLAANNYQSEKKRLPCVLIMKRWWPNL